MDSSVKMFDRNENSKINSFKNCFLVFIKRILEIVYYIITMRTHRKSIKS